MKSYGIDFGVIGEAEENAPWVYEGSHVLPSEDGARRGSLSVSAIPDEVVMTRQPDLPEEESKSPWLRFDVSTGWTPSPDGGIEGDDATVILDRNQVLALRDTLTDWLDAEEVV